MGRITKSDLDQLVVVVRNAAGEEGYAIEYSVGLPRLYLGARDITPRLPARELAAWLEGFIKGLQTDVEEEGEEEEVYDNPSYRGYYIYPDLAQQEWFIIKGHFHIATARSEEEAQRTIDDLLNDDE